MKNVCGLIMLTSVFIAVTVLGISCNHLEEMNNDPISLKGISLSAEKFMNQVWDDGATQVTDSLLVYTSINSIATNDEHYVFATEFSFDTRQDIIIGTLDQDGQRIGDTTEVPTALNIAERWPSIARANIEDCVESVCQHYPDSYGLVYMKEMGSQHHFYIMFQLINDDGTLNGSPIQVSPYFINNDVYSFSNPSIAWYKGKFGIVYSGKKFTNNSETPYLFFRRIAVNRSKNGTETASTIDSTHTEITTGELDVFPSVSASGQFGVVWERIISTSNRDLLYSRIDSGSGWVSPPVSIKNDTKVNSSPSIVYNSALNEYGVAYLTRASDTGNSYVKFIRIDSNGIVKADISLTSGATAASEFRPSVTVYTTSVNSRYLVAWEDNRYGNSEILYSVISEGRVASTGRISNDVHSSIAPSTCSRLNFSTNTSHPSVIWSDDRYRRGSMWYPYTKNIFFKSPR